MILMNTKYHCLCRELQYRRARMLMLCLYLINQEVWHGAWGGKVVLDLLEWQY